MLDGSGGDGFNGGAGVCSEFDGLRVKNDGEIIVAGGDGDATGGTGGEGGDVAFIVRDGSDPVPGTINQSGGSGDTPGTAGTFMENAYCTF
jgi:hypothetical protein